MSFSSPLGRTSTYGIERLPAGGFRRTFTGADGLATSTTIGADGRTTQVAPDGTPSTVVTGQDPRFGMLAPIAGSSTVTLPSGPPEGQVAILPVVIGIGIGLAADYALGKLKESLCECAATGTL